MKVIITGATGYAGSEVFRQLLADSGVERVIALGRRSMGIKHPKLEERVLSSFLDYSSVAKDLNADACLWCLGVSQTEVSKEKYIEITYDYAMAAARAMWAVNPALRFCFLRGRAADLEEKAGTLYGKIKGRTERELMKLNPNVFTFRPALIRPSRSDEKRRLAIHLSLPIAWVVDQFTDAASVTTATLARCMIDVAKSGAKQQIFVNAEIRHWPLAARA